MAPHAGPEGHEPGDLGDDLVRCDSGARRRPRRDASASTVVGEGGQVLVADDAGVELAHVLGEDAADDLVGVDHADEHVLLALGVSAGSASVMISSPAVGAAGDEVRPVMAVGSVDRVAGGTEGHVDAPGHATAVAVGQGDAGRGGRA